MFSARYAAIKQPLVVVYSVVTFLMVALVVVLSLSPTYNVLYYFNPFYAIDEVEYSVNDTPQGSITLPYNLTGLSPGDKVSVFFKSSGNERDNLLMDVRNTQCALYIDKVAYFSVDDEGTYPAFQKEPPHSINIVALPNVSAGTELRLDYTLSPIADSLKLDPYYSGDQNLITKRILMENYLALILSVMTLILGVSLAVIGLILYSRAEFAIVLFWLGLSCLACGTWTFFANDVTLFFFSQFSVFYTISFIGLYILPVPLMRFCIYYVMPYRPRVFDVAFAVFCAFFALVVILHVSGIVSFGQVEPYFRAGGTLALMAYIALILRARSKGKVSISVLYVLGITMFAALSLFDLAGMFLDIKSSTGTFFMVGLFFATVVVAILMWEYLSDALDAKERNARLEADISAINRSLDLQRKHFQDFSQSVEETRRMRHDLRHQLVAIKGFIQDGKDKEALDYIDDLSKTIPSISEMLVCDNTVVNSLAAFYLNQAEAENILCDVSMVVPHTLGRIPDADLSIIVGNLFENALEACRYVEPEKRFIKVRCSTEAKRFTLIIDNSYDGELQVSGTEFYSRKRKGYGVGIASVRSVVSKYEGSIKYETEPGVFKTSLYVKI
ncbi:MAG: GHKL domain-containing protein [Coriobacteriales bacterium]|jgi:signal transduction histidine kinase|nr:GHKL domain-containing protein [Coriobacteriales bacterium]